MYCRGPLIKFLRISSAQPSPQFSMNIKAPFRAKLAKNICVHLCAENQPSPGPLKIYIRCPPDTKLIMLTGSKVACIMLLYNSNTNTHRQQIAIIAGDDSTDEHHHGLLECIIYFNIITAFPPQPVARSRSLARTLCLLLHLTNNIASSSHPLPQGC